MNSTKNSPTSNELYARFLKPGFLVPALTLIACLVVLYGFVPYATGYWGKARTIASWTYEGWTGKTGDYAHGMLVLPICALIVYLKREKIAQLPLQGNSWGLLVLALGLAMFWIGVKADNAYIGYISAHIVSAGLIIWFFGWGLFKELFSHGFSYFLYGLSRSWTMSWLFHCGYSCPILLIMFLISWGRTALK